MILLLRSLRRLVLAVAPVLALLGPALSHAADDAPPAGVYDVRDRHPQGSIDSTARADAALAQSRSDRTRVEVEYRATARACMDKFLVNDCLNAARELRRKRLAEITSVEVEADRFKRRDRAARADADSAKRESERAAREQGEATTRARNSTTFTERQERAKVDARREAERDKAPPKPRPPPPKPAAEMSPEQRAKNAADHAERVKDANAHREKLAQQHAEKEAERARRAEARAAKAAAATRTGS